ncbi:MAG: prepilin peptidase [Sulfurovum sp.]|nr:prepilin peptidase [Sulfurovum sp.]
MVGSFLNVVIYRIPKGKYCFACLKCQVVRPLRWYHNIPILSWLSLRGKCEKLL